MNKHHHIGKDYADQCQKYMYVVLDSNCSAFSFENYIKRCVRHSKLPLAQITNLLKINEQLWKYFQLNYKLKLNRNNNIYAKTLYNLIIQCICIYVTPDGKILIYNTCVTQEGIIRPYTEHKILNIIIVDKCKTCQVVIKESEHCCESTFRWSKLCIHSITWCWSYHNFYATLVIQILVIYYEMYQ